MLLVSPSRDDETRVSSPVETIKDEEGELTRYAAPIEEFDRYGRLCYE